MRRFWILAFPVFVALACACPGTAGLQETLGAAQNTFGAVLTEMPEVLTQLPEMKTKFPATSDVGKKTPQEKLPGTIRGHLSYPSEYIPAQKIVAFTVAAVVPAADVITVEGQDVYELTVPPGNYFVVAYTIDGVLAAGYSQAVLCGLSAACTDHSLVPVHVEPGAVVTGIDPQDWYAGPGAFPPMP